MNDQDYQKMVDMSYGRVPRDQDWLDNQAILGHIQEEVERKAKFEKEHPSPRSQRTIELEAREFDLKLFGRRHMEKYARPLDGEDRLSVPGDAPAVRLLEHSSCPTPTQEEREKMKMKFHSAGPMRHSEPIRQKLILQRG